MITKADLDQGLQDYLASTSNIKADSNKRVRVLNLVLDALGQYCWKFAIKKKDFAFTAGTTEYCVETTLAIDDFKQIYWLDNRTEYDSRRYDSDQEGISVTIKDRKHYLLCDLDNTGTYDLEYFSEHLAVNTDTDTTQQHFTTTETNESFIGPATLAPLIVQMGYYELLRVAKNVDKLERTETLNAINQLLTKAINEHGYTPKKGIKRIQIKR